MDTSSCHRPCMTSITAGVVPMPWPKFPRPHHTRHRLKRTVNGFVCERSVLGGHTRHRSCGQGLGCATRLGNHVRLHNPIDQQLCVFCRELHAGNNETCLSLHSTTPSPPTPPTAALERISLSQHSCMQAIAHAPGLQPTHHHPYRGLHS
jgi:hypothetical protein